MPQFQMPLDNSEYAVQWQKATIGYFAKGYFEAMFFTECHADNPELENATINDLSPEAWEASLKSCASFEQDNAALLEQAYEQFDYDSEQAGRDFWYTRNGHGVGFWDRDLGDLGDKLTDASDKFNSVDLYMGDDSKLYLA
jgi:hypothetical protein